MNCQVCKKNAATVHITEIVEFNTGADGQPHQLHERHICVPCAEQLNLPQMPLTKKKYAIDIWKLLQQSARRSRQAADLSCPDCGMTLAEFRSRGRLGCPRDYEVFQKQLDPLLHRMHNSLHHVGRLPGLDDRELERQQNLHELKRQLASAIREEAYESAARLRDEIEALKKPSTS